MMNMCRLEEVLVLFLRAGFVSEEIKEIERATRENPDAIQTSVIPIIAS